MYSHSFASQSLSFLQVDLVNLPGVTGTYGVTAGHTPNVTQLTPGVRSSSNEKISRAFARPPGCDSVNSQYIPFLCTRTASNYYRRLSKFLKTDLLKRLTNTSWVVRYVVLYPLSLYLSFLVLSIDPREATVSHEISIDSFTSISGGYAFAMPDNTLQIAATEACKVDDLDAVLVQKQLDESQSKLGSATPGSEEHALAQIEVDTNTAMAQALGL